MSAMLIADAAAWGCVKGPTNRATVPGNWASMLTQQEVNIIVPRILSFVQTVELLQLCVRSSARLASLTMTIPFGWLERERFAQLLSQLNGPSQLHLEIEHITPNDLSNAAVQLKHVLRSCTLVEQLHLHLPLINGTEEQMAMLLDVCPQQITVLSVLTKSSEEQALGMQQDTSKTTSLAPAASTPPAAYPGSSSQPAGKALTQLQHLHIHHGLSELITGLSRCNGSVQLRYQHITLPSLRRITVRRPLLLPELIFALRWAKAHNISLTASLDGKSAAASLAMTLAASPQAGGAQQPHSSGSSGGSLQGEAASSSFPLRRGVSQLSELVGLAAGGGHCLSLLGVGQVDVIKPEQQEAAGQQALLLKACGGIAFDTLEVALVGQLYGKELHAALAKMAAALPEARRVALRMSLSGPGSLSTMQQLQRRLGFKKSLGRDSSGYIALPDSGLKTWPSVTRREAEAEADAGLGASSTPLPRVGVQQHHGGSSAALSPLGSGAAQSAEAALQRVRHLAVSVCTGEPGETWHMSGGTEAQLLELAPALRSLELHCQGDGDLGERGLGQLCRLLEAAQKLRSVKISGSFDEEEVGKLVSSCPVGLQRLELCDAFWLCDSVWRAVTAASEANVRAWGAAVRQRCVAEVVRHMRQLRLLVANIGDADMEASYPGWRSQLLWLMGGQRVVFEHHGWSGEQQLVRGVVDQLLRLV